MYDALTAARDEMDEANATLEALKARSATADAVAAGLSEALGAVKRYTAATEAAAVVATEWLAAHEGNEVVSGKAALALKRTPSSAQIGDGGATTVLSVEDVVVPPSVLQAQLLECVALDAASEELYFQLDEALLQKRIGLEVMLEEVRDVARKQFRARATAQKVAVMLLGARR